MKITKTLYTIFCVIAFLVALISAITMGMHQVAKKDNMVKIADAYLATQTAKMTVKTSQNTEEQGTTSEEEKKSEEQPASEEEEKTEEQPASEEEKKSEEQPTSEEEEKTEEQPTSGNTTNDLLSQAGLDPNLISGKAVTDVLTNLVQGTANGEIDVSSMSGDTLNQVFEDSDISGVSDVLGGLDLSALLSDDSPISSFIGPDITSGISSIMDFIGTLKKVFSGNEGVTSLLLNMVGAGEYIDADMVRRALASEKMKGYSQTAEVTDTTIQLFLQSRMVSHASVEYAFLYYDYLADAKTQDAWKTRYASAIAEIMMDRLVDFSLLLGRGINAEDSEFLSALIDSLGGEMITGATAPNEKFNSYSLTVIMFLRLMFSPSIYIVQFVLLIICAVAVALFTRSWRRGCSFFGGITFLSGAVLLVMYFFQLWDTVVLGKKIIAASGGDILAAQIFLTIGAVLTGIGIILIVVQGLKFTALEPKERKASPEVAEMNEKVLTVDEIQLMTKLNMTDIIASSMKKHKDGEFVDYYGDGRGKALFDAYQRTKVASAEAAQETPLQAAMAAAEAAQKAIEAAAAAKEGSADSEASATPEDSAIPEAPVTVEDGADSSATGAEKSEDSTDSEA